MFQRGVEAFNGAFNNMLDWYERLAYRVLRRPALTAGVLLGGSALLIVGLFPFLGRAYFPRTDPGQFIVHVKMPSGTRIELSDMYVGKVEDVVRHVVSHHDLNMIVSNVGITHGPSTIYSPNSSMDTAYVRVSLKEDHTVGSFAYIARMRAALSSQLPQLQTYFQTGGLVDAVINQGLPAPIDIEISDKDQKAAYAQAQILAAKLRKVPSIGDVYIPQDLKYPGIALQIDRERASMLGLTPRNVVDNVITALTSNEQIAPSYWIDPSSGNQYMVSVQYSDRQLGHMTMDQLESIPLRGADSKSDTPLSSVAFTHRINTPTEVDHYQLRRVIDLYVQPRSEALNSAGSSIARLVKTVPSTGGMRVLMHGAIQSMNTSFERFGLGLVLAVLLVYLILMAQFTSFVDPFIILMAVPPGPCRGHCALGTHRLYAQYHVADGHHHDDRHCCVKQHSHR